MAYQSLKKILLERNRRFLGLVLLPILLLYAGLQSYVFYSAMSKTKEQMSVWLTRNESRITQALYLQNELDLRALLFSQRGANSPEKIEIWDRRGKLVISTEPSLREVKGKKVESRSGALKMTVGWTLDWRRGEVSSFQPLLLVGKKQGEIRLFSRYHWENLKRESFILFISCLVLYLLLSLAVRRLIRILSERVVGPIQKLQTEMNPAIRSLSELTPIEVNGMGDRYPSEVVELYGGYNQLIASIKELQAKETEYVDKAAKMKLATQVAHDIRSPLMVLNMTVDSMPNIPLDQRDLLLAAIERINEMANELLAKNRLEESTGLAPTEPARIVAEMVEEKRRQYGSLERTSIRIEDQSDGAMALLKETDLKRSISNLLDNAVEAMPEGGEITVGVFRSPSHLRISIEDQGIGIPPERLAQILRTGGSYGKKMGNGLGVSFARQTVEAWGGTIEMESEEGLGTSVYLNLPLFQAN